MTAPSRLTWVRIACIAPLVLPFNVWAQLPRPVPAMINGADYRLTTAGKTEVARKLIQDIIDDDRKPRHHFGTRSPPWAIARDQAGYDCGSIRVIARGIEVGQPYFINPDAPVVGHRIALVPVRAEILMVETYGDEGGPKSPMNFTDGGDCGFEYERWSFETKRYERVEGFRSRDHVQEFLRWGESFVETGPRPLHWVAVDLDKRYVRFIARVRVSTPIPYQLAPQFPVHFAAEHSLKLMNHFNSRKTELIAKGKSDRDEKAEGAELADDLQRMQRQLTRDQWVANQLKQSLERLKGITPFEDIKP